MIAIGVDTHKDKHTAVALDHLGQVLGQIEIKTSRAGYKQLTTWAKDMDVDLKFGIEGCGSWGRGLCDYLLDQGLKAFEVEQPLKRSRRRGKSDLEDALHAAGKTLAGEGLSVPRSNGDRDLLRMFVAARDGLVADKTRALNRLHALHSTAPQLIKEHIGQGSALVLARRIKAVRISSKFSEHERTVFALLKDLASYIHIVDKSVCSYERQIEEIVLKLNSLLLDEPGVGALTAAKLLISSPERFSSERSFARINGTAPIPASSGKTQRFRLNRGGDRQLNRAIHIVAHCRARYHDESIAYIERKRKEGKSQKEALRALKRHVSRRLYRKLTATT